MLHNISHQSILRETNEFVKAFDEHKGDAMKLAGDIHKLLGGFPKIAVRRLYIS